MSEVRFKAFEPGTDTFAGFLPEPISAEVSWVHNDLGALKLTYPKGAVNAGLLGAALTTGLDVRAELWNPATELWVEPKSSRFILLARSGTMTLTLPSYGWMLRKTHVWGGSSILVPPDAEEHAGLRPFENQTAGQIMSTLLAENTARGGVAVTPNFTSTLTSLSSAFTETGSFYFAQGTSMFDVLQALTAAGLCDWYMTGSMLSLVNPDEASQDNTSLIRLHVGVDILDAPSTETLEEYANMAYSIMDGGTVATTTDGTAPTPWGTWATVLAASGVDAATATDLRTRALNESARQREEYTRQVTMDSLPMVEWGPGDWITAPASSTTPQTARVKQVTITQTSEGTTAAAILNDRILPSELRLASKVSGIVGGKSPSGTGVPVVLPSMDTRTPSAPTGVSVTSTTDYLQQLGTVTQSMARATISFTGITTATDGTTMTPRVYEVQSRENTTGTEWTKVAESSASPALASSWFRPGVSYLFRVRAFGLRSTTPGSWSSEVAHTMATDTAAPPTPKAPTLTTRLGTIRVYWDGLGAGSEAMPADFAYAEVAVGATSTPTTVVGALLGAGSMTITDQTYNSTRYVRLRTVDTSGNTSAWGAAASTTVTPLVDTDVIGKVLDGAKIMDGSITASDSIIGNTITGGLIQALAIGTGHLAANAVTTDKLDAGAVTAEKIALGTVGYDRLGIGTDELMPNPMWMDATLRGQIALGAGFSWWGESATYGLDGQAAILYISASGTTSAQTVVTPIPVPVTPGERIFGSFTLMGDGTTANYSTSLVINWYDTTDTLISSSTAATNSGTALATHTELSGIVTAPDGAALMRAKVYTSAPSSGERSTFRFVNRVSLRRVLSATALDGEYSEVAPDGLRIWGQADDRDSDPDIELTAAQRGLSLRDDADAVRASMRMSTFDGDSAGMFTADDDGLWTTGDELGVVTADYVTATALNVSHDLLYKNKPLLDQVGGRIIARADRIYSGVTIAAGGNRDVLQLSFDAHPDRTYRVTVIGPGVNAGSYYASARIKRGLAGYIPTVADSAESGSYTFCSGTAATLGTSWYYYKSGGSAEKVTVVYNIGGNPTASVTTSSTYTLVRMLVEDLGPTVPDTGIDRDGSTTPTTTKQQTVGEYTPAWQADYNEGTLYTYSPSTKIYQGEYSTYGFNKSLIRFPDSMYTAISTGGTVDKLEVYLHASHWYYGSGGTAVIRPHTNASSSAPSTYSGEVAVTALNVGFARGEGKWVTLPSDWYTSFDPNGTYYRGVALVGAAGLGYYGYFDTTQTRVRVTYTKEA